MQEKNSTGTLKRGLLIDGERHVEFELRPCTAADYFGAEDDTPAAKTISFEAALAARQLVRIGTFKGPFSLALLGKLSPADLNTLVEARRRLEVAGEADEDGKKGAGAPS